MPFKREVQGEKIREGLFRRLVHVGDLMTVVLDFTDGPWVEAEPPHQHPHVQTCYIVSGKIIFYCEGEDPVTLQAGDMFFVPPDTDHSIKLLSESARLVDSFNPKRVDFL